MKKNLERKSPKKSIKKKLKPNNFNEEIDDKIPIQEPKPEDLVQPIELVDNLKNEENENQKKLEEILANADKETKYNFNLHKHLKENIKLKDNQCKDGLTKDTLYCLECKFSTCPNCPLFKIHNGHPLVKKSPYYSCDDNIINDNFSDIDYILEIDPDFLDPVKVKEELKKNVKEGIIILQNKLNEIKESKLKEIESLFEKTENCVEQLKEKIKKLKEDIKIFLEKQKSFLCIDITESSTLNQNNPQADEVMKNLQEGIKTNIGLITPNKDSLNVAFLINYDLLKNTEYLNNQIIFFINNIRKNKENFLIDFDKKKNIVYEDLEKMMEFFSGTFNYQYLTTEFYKIIYEKISKYNDEIENMKRKIMDKVNNKGNFEDIEDENKISGTKINIKFEKILNSQITDEEEEKTKKTNKKTTTSDSKSPKFIKSKSKSGLRNSGTILDSNTKLSFLNEKIYNNPDEVKLDKGALQEYFFYDVLNLVNKNFKIKKKNNEDIVVEFDEEVDLAKPIPGKSEIQVYDRKARNIIKKNVKFDKNKHKYLNFLNGCRSVLIKDKLYIFGGVDKENNTTKVAWVYYIKENNLKPIPDMLHPHAYHEVQFLEYYKSIVVIGGQNCNSCELYDFSIGLWRDLPELKIPRAHCILYLDRVLHRLYSFFGIIGKISEKNNNYSDAIEMLEFRKLALGWKKLDYNNRADISFRTGINQILPLNPEMILVYGGTSIREFIKKAAVFVLAKQEMVKIDNRMFNIIREASKNSKKLSKILCNID